MSIRHGRPVLSIPGPTTVPDDVLNAMHQQAIDIYSGPLVATTDSCLSDLKTLFGTKGHSFIYIANGHGGWEAALSNVLSGGDKVLILESGRFALGWGMMAEKMGVEIEVLPGSWRRAVDPAAVEARLRADTEGEIKAVLVVQIDTASSVINDIPAIRQAITNAGHGALYMVDTIASLGIVPFTMDAWGVDVCVSAAQKGLMTPPGLTFLAANDKAMAAHEEADLVTHYWDWTARLGDIHYQKYCGTPPEHLLFALRKALDILFDEGVEKAQHRHALLAEAVRRAVAVWAEGGSLAFNIESAAERANSVTTILTEGFDPATLRAFCAETCGVTIGGAIGDLEGKGLRIGHMGHVNAPSVLGTLGAIEIGLIALGIPHGRGGVQAAVDWLGQSVAV
ncbi:aminotransferase class V-fold PLP-dependent enzyme [Breoghania sp. L-A4]|uniref:pyridoxal-phosphate-dependent aminotransferase family protein n=1 Tax=Breoghania sp. L-A4 TaxID=2304600 RepID=UPI000E35AC39|nr:aminotransferase class V-fold PLP-dependent enzyme [Breoghania sp. L-A4]AXS40303.1 aminotransferase class V-fold PLP-dependent enzyme [Breoghania sp. L-A4]